MTMTLPSPARIAAVLLLGTLSAAAIAAQPPAPPTPLTPAITAPPQPPLPPDPPSVAAVRGGYLGVQILELNPALRRHFGAPADRGLLVAEVAAGSPAAAAGLRVGDLLLALDGTALDSARRLTEEVRRRGDGTAVRLSFQRAGETREVTAALATREHPVLDLGQLPRLTRQDGSGVTRIHVYEPHANATPDGTVARQVIEIRQRDLEDAMETLQQRLQDPEFQQRIQEAARRSVALEQRTAALEQRLRELQQRLAELEQKDLR